jgi:hydrogenase nickel incorporation protein HypA/HybF
VHELSICGAIADIVTRRSAGRPVAVVHLRIGRLRQVVPDTLVFCWSLVNAETALADSRLEVQTVEARISCHDCGACHELGDFPILVCGTCQSSHVQVDSGDEFLITSLDLAEA